MDHVHRASRPEEPYGLEVEPRVDLPRLRIRMDRRIVRDNVAVGGEAADDQEVPVGAGEKEAGQDAVDRRDKGDAGGDEALRLGQRAKARDESLETVPRGIGRVERPVASALVAPV